MKAPDKLYIGRRNYGPLIGGWKSQPFTSKEIESIEYIRKDALMEWLKLEKDRPFPEDYERGCIDGRNGLREELIDKLNSI